MRQQRTQFFRTGRVIERMKRLAFILMLAAGWLQFAAPACGQGLDYRILCSLQQHRTPAMDHAMVWVSNSLVLAPAVPAAMAIGGWCADNQPLLQSAAQTGAAFGATAVVTMGLKYLVGRPRPYQAYPDDLICVKPEWSPSFPSGHTSMAFGTATSLSLQYPRWYVAVPALAWASAVGFSRMYLGVHYPSDVLAGALLGAASAYVAFRVQERLRAEQGLPSPAEAKALVLPLSIRF